MTDKEEQEIRAAFEIREHALSEAYDAADKITSIISEQTRLHGAKAVVEWLKTRHPRRLLSPAGDKDQFFMDVLHVLPGRGAKGTLIRILCDAAEALKTVR